MNFTEARDEILELFAGAWGNTTPLFFWDRPHDPPKTGDWARVTVRHTLGRNDAIGNRRFERQGVVTVQIFTVFGEGLSSSDYFSKIAADAFQGKATPGGAWFRNVRMNEVCVDGKWFQVNVIADFTYCEVI